jgi:excisionase family DNA binding protein
MPHKGDNNHQITSGGINMKNDQLKEALILTLQHIQQTNELLSSLISMIKDMEDEPLPVVVETSKEKYEEKHPEFLSTNKAAEFIGCSRAYIYHLVHERKIPCYKPTGKYLFFKKSELEECLFRGRQATDYELLNKADEILNNMETRRMQPRRKNRKG